MKIISLTSENIKRISVVEIHPDGSLVIIGGRNEQGKTSVLDSIEYCLGGTDSVPSMPIRKGEDKARIVADLGDLTVTRTFTQKGSKLVVANKDGSMHRTPQAILDSLTGRLSFDPLEFSRMKPDQQVATLKSLVGLDFGGLDREREKTYSDRTVVNREVKALQVKIEGIPKQDVPEEEISIAELAKEQERRISKNSSNAVARNLHQKLGNDISRNKKELELLKQDLEGLQKTILDRNMVLATLETQWAKESEILPTVIDEDIDSIRTAITQAEKTNVAVRSNKKREELVGMFELKTIEVDALSQKIDEIDTEKASQLGSAKFPIPELGFTENGVIYKDIPFDQCSSAEKLRVSLSIGIALNPKLKVLLVRDGSLLDQDSLKLITEMIEKSDHQLWLEKVSEGKECSIIIEDGKVKE